MEFHQDLLRREETIRNYLLRRLDANAAEAFESHYLSCDDCFEELRASQLLVAGLGQTKVDLRRVGDVVVLGFTVPAGLTRQSQELQELMEGVLQQKDTKVLIDLGRVSRIDSRGLGMLMACYAHAVRNQGMLKLLNPGQEVQNLLRLTRMDTVLETHYDEGKALQSFQVA
jgi:anti-sigma B factor antagonist